jgi:NAD-dependent deacetylase
MNMERGLIVLLTGAGISAESGIKTFRDSNGLWETYRTEEVASPEGFERHPAVVQAFYNRRRAQLREAGIEPNAAHHALARLEREWPGEVWTVTQNVDDLHERAGSRNLIHMHGELIKARCLKTGQVHPWPQDITPESACPCCLLTGTLRPHIVWFGEVPLEMHRIFDLLGRCAIFAAIGTSGQVYPAAGFVHTLPQRARTFEINLQASEISSSFQQTRLGPASQQVPAWVSELLGSATR